MIFSNCFRLICTRFPFTITQPASRFSSASLRNFFSPIRKYFDASSIVSVYFSQIGTSVLFVMYKHPLYCVSFGSRQTALGKLRWYLNRSHFYEQNHLWDVSLSCEYRSWQSDFSKGRSRITAWVAHICRVDLAQRYPWPGKISSSPHLCLVRKPSFSTVEYASRWMCE